MAKLARKKIITKKHLARVQREKIQRRWILGISIGIISIILILIGYAVLNEYVLKYRAPVARVNGTTITRAEFHTMVRYRRLQLINQYTQTAQFMSFFGDDPNSTAYFQQQLSQIINQLDNSALIGADVLNQMIDAELIRQEATRRNITVTQEEIDIAIQEAFGYYATGTPAPTSTATPYATSTWSPTQFSLVTITPIPTETPLPSATPSTTPAPTEAPTETSTPTLAPTATATAGPSPTPTATATPYTLEEYNKNKTAYLDAIKDLDFTETELRMIFETDILTKKLIEAMAEEANITPVQEQLWARHILVQDEATAQDLYQRLQKGEDWTALAAEFSQDTSNKDNGGDLSWFYRGMMDPAFEEAAFALTIGEISQPVKSGFGWHLIQLLGREERPLTQEQLDQQKNKIFQDWLTQAQDADTIQRMDTWTLDLPTEPELDPQLRAYAQGAGTTTSP